MSKYKIPTTPKEGQKQHENIVTLLKQFEAFNKKLEISPKQKHSGEYKNIDTNDINTGVHVFLEVLNLGAGSSGSVQLYHLLQTYLKDETKRKEINYSSSIIHNYYYQYLLQY